MIDKVREAEIIGRLRQMFLIKNEEVTSCNIDNDTILFKVGYEFHHSISQEGRDLIKELKESTND